MDCSQMTAKGKAVERVLSRCKMLREITENGAWGWYDAATSGT